MSPDLEIQFKWILRITVLANAWLCMAIGVGTQVNAQLPVQRYPLELTLEDTAARNLPAVDPEVRTGNDHRVLEVVSALPKLSEARSVQAAAVEPKASEPPTSELTSALENARTKFADQFNQAYTRIARLETESTTTNANPSGKVSRLPVSKVGQSIIEFKSSKDQRQINATQSSGNPTLPADKLPRKISEPRVSERFSSSSLAKSLSEPRVSSSKAATKRVGQVYPLVAPLPKLASPADRLPRVAQLPNEQASSASNDFVVSSLPSLPSLTTQQGDVPNADEDSQLNWWNQLVTRPLHPQNEVQQVDSNLLVYLALENSPRIQALSRDPLIRDFEVVEADAAFDAVSFLQTQFADRSDPIGGALDATRDGRDTIENHRWTAEGGLRKQARTGATYELSQRLGFENSNVAVFDPNNQGTAQLALNVTQPLGRGRGRYINQSQILLAQSRGGAAWETFATELQSEIEAVVSAYWRLYFDRSVFLQKKRNVERVAEILATLEGRANLDSLPSQITRARASLQSRKTDLANAFRDVRNSETELRRLIADRNWKANQFIELLPVETPVNQSLEVSLDHVVTTSLQNRPEIRETLQQVKRATIERDISVNDLLPELSLLLGTYVSTLQDNGRFGEAFVDQFGETKPGYSVGLEFEMPLGNRIARSRLVQRKLQLAKMTSQVDEVMQNVIADSQVALRRLNSASETLQAANQSIGAAKSDLEQNILRWENFALVEGDFSDGQTPTTVLDQLLDSQERLAASELVAAQSQLELKVAEVALQRAMGTLLIQKQIHPRRAFHEGVPKIKF